MEAVLNTVRELDDAFNRGDIDAVLDFYDDDAVMVVRPGKVARGRAELRNAFTTLLGSGNKAEQEKVHVLESGGIALFISSWRLVDPGGTDRRLTATSVFRLGADGRWRLLIDNSFGPAVL